MYQFREGGNSSLGMLLSSGSIVRRHGAGGGHGRGANDWASSAACAGGLVMWPCSDVELRLAAAVSVLSWVDCRVFMVGAGACGSSNEDASPFRHIP